MADAIVSFVIERLGDYLIQEIVFLQGVRQEVDSLKKDLEWMLSFLKDAEAKQVNNPLIRQWISDILDIAYDSEDVLDKFMLEMHDKGGSNLRRLHEGETSNRRQRLFTFLKCSCICSKGQEMINLYGIGEDIRRLKNRLNDVSSRRQQYGLENINNMREGESTTLGRLKELRRITSFQLADINVVGYKDDTSKLLAQLLDEKKSQRLVISIFGTGGLGKTTLAGKLYHHEAVKHKFHRRAWISVSQNYKTHDLLQRIIKSFNKGDTSESKKLSEDDMKKSSEEDLGRYLHQSLEGYPYLMVIDDIWDKEAWEILKKAFPDNKNGSRVIITTRNRDVAERVDHNTVPHALRFLGLDESWELFREKAFKNLKPDERLENLGKEMVKKCGGLPLAIVVLGGLLATKYPQEWSRVHDHLWRNLSSDSIEISHLLALSFDDLPSELKVCFLYLGHFPEDYEIDSERLIRLWVAEGFIQRKGKTLEESAEDIFNELVNRSLLQISRQRRVTGRTETYQLHDLLRDLAIQKAKDFHFIRINDEADISTQSSVLPRRQAVYLETDTCSWLEQCNQRSRSLLLFNRYPLPCELSTICTRFRFLRVLNLNECYIGEQTNLPEEIGMLIHLKYLELGNTSIQHLPPSIGNLCSLQTLVLPTLGPLYIPNEICKLKKLRHLVGIFVRLLEIENLENLQTLKELRNQSWSKLITEKLVNLRELRIIISSNSEEGVFSFDSVGNLKSLRSLFISISGKNRYFGSLQPLSRCQHLRELFLEGRITKLPENLHEILPNLECVTLKEPSLEADPLPALEKLPSLTHLQLDLINISNQQDDAFCSHVKKMICSANGFPLLEILVVCAGRLPEWQVEDGALPMLRSLIFLSSHELAIPERLRSIEIIVETTEASGLYFC